MDRNTNQSTMNWDLRHLIDSARHDFLLALAGSKDSPIESFLSQIPESARPILLIDLIAIEIQFRRERGENPTLHEYIDRFPEESDWLQRHFESLPDSSEVAQSTRTAPYVQINPGIESVELKEQILNRYQPMERLGRGGFGEVWSARDSLLGRLVAVKQLRVDRQFSAVQAQMLLKEGQRLAQLNHPNIVRVLDVGLANGQFYLVSELMPGGTLDEWLKGHTASFEQAARWTAILARALHHAHGQGLVHRDVKPSNILRDAHGEPHLADFGLAVSEEELAGESPQAVGSIYYMPPEQARGESHLADPRSDVYSLGMVLYRLLTGRLPYSTTTDREYRQEILTREPRPLRAINSEIPQSLEAICLKCLNKSINQRPATALEVAEHLEQWAVTQSTGDDQPHRPPKRGWALLAIGILCVMLAVVTFQKSRKLNVGPVPPGPAAGLPNPLTSPELISWMPYDIHDNYSYSDKARRFEFDAFGQALFRTGSHSAGSHTFRADFGVTRWIGSAGIFWCLNKSEDGLLHCWAAFAGRDNANRPFTVDIAEFTIGPGVAGRQSVIASHIFKRIPTKVPSDSRIVMRVKADTQNVEQVWINELKLLDVPIQLPKSKWTQAENFGTGVGGHLGKVSVFESSVE